MTRATIFADTTFTLDEIDAIHNRFDGHPGTLHVIRNTVLQEPDTDLALVLEQGHRLEKQRLTKKLSKCSTSVLEALKLVAVSPSALNIEFLSVACSTEVATLKGELDESGLASVKPGSNSVTVGDRDRRTYLIELLNIDEREMVRLLEGLVVQHDEHNHFLLSLIAEKTSDYERLTSLLSTDTAIEQLHTTAYGISNVKRTLRSASRIAAEQQNIPDLTKWALLVAVLKAYIAHGVNSSDIDALVSIGEHEAALGRAYAIPEITRKIQALASIYTAMRSSRKERIPPDALNELEQLVSTVNIDGVEQEIIQQLAVDLFPILPDTAMKLIEELRQSEQQYGIFEYIAKITQEVDHTNMTDGTDEDIPFVSVPNRQSLSGNKAFPMSPWKDELSTFRTQKQKNTSFEHGANRI